MAEFTLEREVPVPQEVAWEVISDHGGFGEAAPNLSRVEVVEGEGLGMHRRCYNAGGKGWSETCTLWQPGTAYRFEVDTSDYPYPFSKMQGTWRADHAPTGARVGMHYVFELKYGPLGAMLRPVVTLLFRRACKQIMNTWEARMLELARTDNRRNHRAHTSPARAKA